jgi:cytochrome c biogenesis protein
MNYASINPGRFVDLDALPPYAVTLDSFAVTYTPSGSRGGTLAGDFAAHVTTRSRGRTGGTRRSV